MMDRTHEDAGERRNFGIIVYNPGANAQSYRLPSLTRPANQDCL